MHLYKELLYEHYKNPRHKGRLSEADFQSAHYNPSCGDALLFEGRVNQNILVAVAFEGKGCVMSMATASLLSEWALNRSLDEIMAVTPEDMQRLIDLSVGPTRLRCVLLSLEALKDGIKQYRQHHAQ